MTKLKSKYKIIILIVALVIISTFVIQRMRTNTFITSIEQSNLLGVVDQGNIIDIESCNLTTLQNGNTVLSLFDNAGGLNLALIDTINSAPSFVKNRLSQNIDGEFEKALICGALTQKQIDDAKEALSIM